MSGNAPLPAGGGDDGLLEALVENFPKPNFNNAFNLIKQTGGTSSLDVMLRSRARS